MKLDESFGQSGAKVVEPKHLYSSVLEKPRTDQIKFKIKTKFSKRCCNVSP